MVRVRVLRTFRRGDTGEVCRIGTEVEVPDAMAQVLVAHGYARPVESPGEAPGGADQLEEPEKDSGDAKGADKGGGKKRAKQ